MKRQRESTVEKQPKSNVNPFLAFVHSNSELLPLIFDHLDYFETMLPIYRILYQYFEENKCVLKVMEKYLKQYADDFDHLNQYLFKRELCDYTERWNGICSIGYCIESLTEYNMFRFTKNFVEFGLCENCGNLPSEIAYFEKIHDNDENELESEYIYICKNCKENDKEKFEKFWLTSKEFINVITSEYLCNQFSKCHIRWMYDCNRGQALYYKSDASRIVIQY